MKIFLGFIFVFSIVGAIPSNVSAQAKLIDFRQTVEKRLADKKLKLTDICPVDDNVVAHRVFKDYGAMFIADEKVIFPNKCVFTSDDEVFAFQNKVKRKSVLIGRTNVELQERALEALLEAREDAAKKGLTISPRGATASRRSFSDTSRIWISRFEPGLRHWQSAGKISAADAERARRALILDQVAQVIEWEKNQMWFSTGLNRSIFSSVAAPGTSQHLAMIAFDVAEFGDKNVRAVLNKHGWFQTIIDDTPHFTYLGRDEEDLPKHGLRAEVRNGFKFWIPNFNEPVRVKAETNEKVGK